MAVKTNTMEPLSDLNQTLSAFIATGMEMDAESMSRLLQECHAAIIGIDDPEPSAVRAEFLNTSVPFILSNMSRTMIGQEEMSCIAFVFGILYHLCPTVDPAADSGFIEALHDFRRLFDTGQNIQDDYRSINLVQLNDFLDHINITDQVKGALDRIETQPLANWEAMVGNIHALIDVVCERDDDILASEISEIKDKYLALNISVQLADSSCMDSVVSNIYSLLNYKLRKMQEWNALAIKYQNNLEFFVLLRDFISQLVKAPTLNIDLVVVLTAILCDHLTEAMKDTQIVQDEIQACAAECAGVIQQVFDLCFTHPLKEELGVKVIIIATFILKNYFSKMTCLNVWNALENAPLPSTENGLDIVQCVSKATEVLKQDELVEFCIDEPYDVESVNCFRLLIYVSPFLIESIGQLQVQYSRLKGARCSPSQIEMNKRIEGLSHMLVKLKKIYCCLIITACGLRPFKSYKKQLTQAQDAILSDPTKPSGLEHLNLSKADLSFNRKTLITQINSIPIVFKIFVLKLIADILKSGEGDSFCTDYIKEAYEMVPQSNMMEFNEQASKEEADMVEALYISMNVKIGREQVGKEDIASFVRMLRLFIKPGKDYSKPLILNTNTMLVEMCFNDLSEKNELLAAFIDALNLTMKQPCIIQLFITQLIREIRKLFQRNIIIEQTNSQLLTWQLFFKQLINLNDLNFINIKGNNACIFTEKRYCKPYQIHQFLENSLSSLSMLYLLVNVVLPLSLIFFSDHSDGSICSQRQDDLTCLMCECIYQCNKTEWILDCFVYLLKAIFNLIYEKCDIMERNGYLDSDVMTCSRQINFALVFACRIIVRLSGCLSIGACFNTGLNNLSAPSNTIKVIKHRDPCFSKTNNVKNNGSMELIEIKLANHERLTHALVFAFLEQYVNTNNPGKYLLRGTYLNYSFIPMSPDCLFKGTERIADVKKYLQMYQYEDCFGIYIKTAFNFDDSLTRSKFPEVFDELFSHENFQMDFLPLLGRCISHCVNEKQVASKCPPNLMSSFTNLFLFIPPCISTYETLYGICTNEPSIEMLMLLRVVCKCSTEPQDEFETLTSYSQILCYLVILASNNATKQMIDVSRWKDTLVSMLQKCVALNCNYTEAISNNNVASNGLWSKGCSIKNKWVTTMITTIIDLLNKTQRMKLMKPVCCKYPSDLVINSEPSFKCNTAITFTHNYYHYLNYQGIMHNEDANRYTVDFKFLNEMLRLLFTVIINQIRLDVCDIESKEELNQQRRLSSNYLAQVVVLSLFYFAHTLMHLKEARKDKLIVISNETDDAHHLLEMESLGLEELFAFLDSLETPRQRKQLPVLIKYYNYIYRIINNLGDEGEIDNPICQHYITEIAQYYAQEPGIPDAINYELICWNIHNIQDLEHIDKIGASDIWKAIATIIITASRLMNQMMEYISDQSNASNVFHEIKSPIITKLYLFSIKKSFQLFQPNIISIILGQKQELEPCISEYLHALTRIYEHIEESFMTPFMNNPCNFYSLYQARLESLDSSNITLLALIQNLYTEPILYMDATISILKRLSPSIPINVDLDILTQKYAEFRNKAFAHQLHFNTNNYLHNKHVETNPVIQAHQDDVFSDLSLYNIPHNSKYSGLHNFGTTCYINCILHELFFNSLFTQKLETLAHLISDSDKKVEGQNIILDLYSLYTKWKNEEDTALQLHKLLDVLMSEKVIERIDIQSDAIEFFVLLLEKLDDISQKINSSSLSDVFQFKRITKQELACGHSIETNETNWNMTLSLIEFTSELRKQQPNVAQLYPLQNVIDLKARPEESLSQSNIFRDCVFNGCNGDGTNEGSKSRVLRTTEKIESPAKTLVIDLPRIVFDGQHDWTKWFNIKVNPVLDLSKMTVGNSNCHYVLSGLVAHLGTQDSGHYMSLCRERKALNTKLSLFDLNEEVVNGEWYLCNDLVITKRPKEMVFKHGSDGDFMVVQKPCVPYILFYDLVDNVEDSAHIENKNPTVVDLCEEVPKESFDNVNMVNYISNLKPPIFSDRLDESIIDISYHSLGIDASYEKYKDSVQGRADKLLEASNNLGKDHNILVYHEILSCSFDGNTILDAKFLKLFAEVVLFVLTAFEEYGAILRADNNKILAIFLATFTDVIEASIAQYIEYPLAVLMLIGLCAPINDLEHVNVPQTKIYSKLITTLVFSDDPTIRNVTNYVLFVLADAPRRMLAVRDKRLSLQLRNRIAKAISDMNSLLCNVAFSGNITYYVQHIQFSNCFVNSILQLIEYDMSVITSNTEKYCANQEQIIPIDPIINYIPCVNSIIDVGITCAATATINDMQLTDQVSSFVNKIKMIDKEILLIFDGADDTTRTEHSAFIPYYQFSNLGLALTLAAYGKCTMQLTPEQHVGNGLYMINMTTGYDCFGMGAIISCLLTNVSKYRDNFFFKNSPIITAALLLALYKSPSFNKSLWKYQLDCKYLLPNYYPKDPNVLENLIGVYYQSLGEDTSSRFSYDYKDYRCFFPLYDIFNDYFMEREISVSSPIYRASLLLLSIKKAKIIGLQLCSDDMLMTYGPYVKLRKSIYAGKSTNKKILSLAEMLWKGLRNFLFDREQIQDNELLRLIIFGGNVYDKLFKFVDNMCRTSLSGKMSAYVYFLSSTLMRNATPMRWRQRLFKYVMDFIHKMYLLRSTNKAIQFDYVQRIITTRMIRRNNYQSDRLFQDELYSISFYEAICKDFASTLRAEPCYFHLAFRANHESTASALTRTVLDYLYTLVTTAEMPSATDEVYPSTSSGNVFVFVPQERYGKQLKASSFKDVFDSLNLIFLDTCHLDEKQKTLLMYLYECDRYVLNFKYVFEAARTMRTAAWETDQYYEDSFNEKQLKELPSLFSKSPIEYLNEKRSLYQGDLDADSLASVLSFFVLHYQLIEMKRWLVYIEHDTKLTSDYFFPTHLICLGGYVGSLLGHFKRYVDATKVKSLVGHVNKSGDFRLEISCDAIISECLLCMRALQKLFTDHCLAVEYINLRDTEKDFADLGALADLSVSSYVALLDCNADESRKALKEIKALAATMYFHTVRICSVFDVVNDVPPIVVLKALLSNLETKPDVRTYSSSIMCFNNTFFKTFPDFVFEILNKSVVPSNITDMPRKTILKEVRLFFDVLYVLLRERMSNSYMTIYEETIRIHPTVWLDGLQLLDAVLAKEGQQESVLNYLLEPSRARIFLEVLIPQAILTKSVDELLSYIREHKDVFPGCENICEFIWQFCQTQ